jgi:hypothetical protein
MSSSDKITTVEAWIPSLSERMEALLDEAAQQTGRSREEILHFCLKHGIERMLQEWKKSDSP